MSEWVGSYQHISTNRLYNAIHVGSHWKIQDRRQIKTTDNKQTKHNPEKANNAKHSKTKLQWLSHLLQHSARKRGEIILQCSWAHTRLVTKSSQQAWTITNHQRLFCRWRGMWRSDEVDIETLIHPPSHQLTTSGERMTRDTADHTTCRYRRQSNQRWQLCTRSTSVDLLIDPQHQSINQSIDGSMNE